jgi:hypothetical protein
VSEIDELNQETGTPVPGELTEAEQKASDFGWKKDPNEMSDPTKWVSAEEFNFRGELMGRIARQNKDAQARDARIETLEGLVRAQLDSQKTLAKQSAERAIRDLRAQRRQALENGDFAEADEIEEQMDNVKERVASVDTDTSLPTPPPAPAGDAPQPIDLTKLAPNERAFFDYVSTDTRFHNNQELIQTVGNFADRLVASGETLTTAQFLRKVDDFTNRSVRGTPAGGPQGQGNTPPRNQQSTTTYRWNDLTETEKSIVRTFVETGTHKTEQEAIDEIASVGGLEIQEG